MPLFPALPFQYLLFSISLLSAYSFPFFSPDLTVSELPSSSGDSPSANKIEFASGNFANCPDVQGLLW